MRQKNAPPKGCCSRGLPSVGTGGEIYSSLEGGRNGRYTPAQTGGGATGPRRRLLKPEAMTGSTPIFPTTPAVQPRKEPGGRGGPKKTARGAGQASRCAKRIRTTGHGADERSRAQSRKARTRGPGRTTQRREVKSTPGPRRCPCSCSSGAVGLNANPHAPRRGSPISLA